MARRCRFRFSYWLRFLLQSAQRLSPSTVGLGQSLWRPSSFRFARLSAWLVGKSFCRSWRVRLALVAFDGFWTVALGFDAVLVAFRLRGWVLPALAGSGSAKVNSKVRPIARVCGLFPYLKARRSLALD